MAGSHKLKNMESKQGQSHFKLQLKCGILLQKIDFFPRWGRLEVKAVSNFGIQKLFLEQMWMKHKY